MNRTRKRQLEHSAAQYKANQAILKEKAEQVASLLNCDPTIERELSLKRSLRCKDPKTYSDINELPTKALKNCISEVILKGDQQAV